LEDVCDTERAGLGKGLDILAVHLSAAVDGPFLLFLTVSDLGEDALRSGERTALGWQDLVQRVCRP
jgi:polyketide synthase 12